MVGRCIGSNNKNVLHFRKSSTKITMINKLFLFFLSIAHANGQLFCGRNVHIIRLARFIHATLNSRCVAYPFKFDRFTRIRQLLTPKLGNTVLCFFCFFFFSYFEREKYQQNFMWFLFGVFDSLKPTQSHPLHTPFHAIYHLVVGFYLQITKHHTFQSFVTALICNFNSPPSVHFN